MTTLIAGRYEVGALIGVGGNARVYAGRDRVLDRPVAIKLVDTDEVRSRDPAGRERFVAEARTSAGFIHPNAVAVFDAGERDGALFLVMELVDGETLAQRLTRGRLSAEQAIQIAADVLAALRAAHERGIVHRDVKPANILIDRAGTSKLADFGIAKRLDDLAAGLTMNGQVFGTPTYLSPEQVRGIPVTAATDVYAVGVVLYEMLSGGPPFAGGDAIATALAHRDAVAPDLRDVRADISPALASIVERALRKDPRERFASAAAMRAALIDAGAAIPPHANRATDRTAVMPAQPRRANEFVLARRARRRTTVAATLAAIVGLGAIGVAFVAARSGDDSTLVPATSLASTPPAGAEAPPVVTLAATPSPSTTAPTPATTMPSSTTSAAPSTTLPPTTTTPPPTDLPSLLAFVLENPAMSGEHSEELVDRLRVVEERNGKKRRDAIKQILEDVREWADEDEIEPVLADLVVEILDPDEEDDDDD